jgi:hypothetical protein
VLFSDETVANTINEKFEPVWVSVRDVPTVTIDFGKGHKIMRTLHGNVATHVLTADGTIVDILPGLYESQEYLAQLDQLWWVHHYMAETRNPTVFLADYHGKQMHSIKTTGKPMEVRPYADMSKMAIEISTKTILRPPGWSKQLKTNRTTETIEHPDFSKPNELAHWKKLREDTEINEKERRAPIHAMLASRPNAKPDDVTKQLYREVLHADIEDPYLGLGETLFKDYPFREDVPTTLKSMATTH